MSTSATVKSEASAVPVARRDWLPAILPVALALLALPLIGNGSTWVTLTFAGIAMGMMIFLMASGLTLVFGLMDVLNFGHGAFIAVGAYVAAAVLLHMSGFTQVDSLWSNLGATALAAGAAVIVTAGLGVIFERLLIRPVYGQHLKQILITMGGFIVAEQGLHAVFGAVPLSLPLPTSFRGSFSFGDVTIEKFRLGAMLVGLAVFFIATIILTKTKIGLLVRAGVENPEMVESLGYRVRRLFVAVFVAGSALAGLGGSLWALYRETVTAAMGMEIMVLVFIVIIVGGLGSIGGCFIGSLLVALLANYAGFLEPKVALISNILLMALVLMWRPQGLYPVAKR